MKKIKKYVFVTKKTYAKFLHRCQNLLNPLLQELKNLGIEAKLYLVGSGKHSIVMQLVIDGEKKAFDIDFNLEITLEDLPKKYRELEYLKETIRSTLNKILHKTDYFSDGRDSTSVLSVPVHFEDDLTKTKFSFDIAIVSRNKNGDLQKIKHIKENDSFTWNLIKDSKDIELKAEKLKSAGLWKNVREQYRILKNRFIDDENHPSCVCYIMAVNNIYTQAGDVHSSFYQSHFNPNWDSVGDSAEDD